jgi:hypothetical protein
MRRFAIAGVLLFPMTVSPWPIAHGPWPDDPALKKEAIASIDRRGAEMTRLSLQVWEFA